jgi:hypothetical protein
LRSWNLDRDQGFFFPPFSGGLPRVKTMQGRLIVIEGRGYPLVHDNAMENPIKINFLNLSFTRSNFKRLFMY